MNELSEARFLDALHDIFLAFDGSGTPVVWNQATEDVTGYSEAELSTMAATDFFVEADSSDILDAISEQSETGEAVVTTELVTADGERIPYEVKIRTLSDETPTTYAIIGSDISDRTRHEETINGRERVYREMYEIISDRQTSFSEQVEALLALGRSELDTDYGSLSKIEGDDYIFEIVASDDDSIQSGDVVPLTATNCEIAASSEQTIVLGDVKRDAEEETDRAGYVEWGISCYIGGPVFVDDDVYGTLCFYDTEPRDGQFLDWEVTLVDLMSRWVSYELERQQTNEQLQRQNERLESFASIVSHDLRNPLNVISGSIDLAKTSGDLDHLTRADRALERMERLIDDLLSLSRSGVIIGERESIDLALLSTRCWEDTTTENATLSVETDQTVQADETGLRRLLENVFRNAIEHGGSEVTVRIGDLDDGFYIEDDGSGIPEDERQAVFERGYSTTNSGTGFGLAIVEELASSHGWDVVITDGSDGGARFEFSGVSA